jgi:hypothetical protein
MTEQLQSRPRIQLVCIGKGRAKQDVCLVFREVASDGSRGKERIYSQKHLRHVRVGHVYEVETDATTITQIYTDTVRWLSVWPDKTEAATWQTAAAAFDTLELARKNEQKETGRKLPLELLRPLRDEYWKTNPAGRLAIEVRLLAYLRLVTVRDSSE